MKFFTITVNLYFDHNVPSTITVYALLTGEVDLFTLLESYTVEFNQDFESNKYKFVKCIITNFEDP